MMYIDDILHTEEGYVYNLITDKFRTALEQVMRSEGISIEDFEDTLMDFFLYLREDKKGPFASFHTIRMDSDGARCSWLKTTLFNYISSNVLRRQKKMPTDKFEVTHDRYEENDTVVSEMQKHTAILLFEKVNETYSAPERIIFFYDLIEKAGIAHSAENISLTSILHISDGYLRVMRTRLKQKIKKFVIEIEKSAL